MLAKHSLAGSTFQKALRWLDVGCGNGAFTEEVIARCAPAAVMAIDPSEDQLVYARTRTRVETADFRVGDAQKLVFGDGSFDIATMALVISFLSEPGKAVAEMARVVCDLADGLQPTCGIFQAVERPSTPFT